MYQLEGKGDTPQKNFVILHYSRVSTMQGFFLAEGKTIWGRGQYQCCSIYYAIFSSIVLLYNPTPYVVNTIQIIYLWKPSLFRQEKHELSKINIITKFKNNFL